MIRVARKFGTLDGVEALTDLFVLESTPACVRFDDGPAYVAERVTSGNR